VPVFAKTDSRLPALLFTYSPSVRRVAKATLPVLYRGVTVECPCCDHTFRGFIPRHGVDSLCPNCLGLQRHRLLALYLRNDTAVTTGTLDVLHIAPEDGLRERLSRLVGDRYVSMDASPAYEGAIVGDVTAMPFDSGSFDLVICSHVLEHVEDDAAALAEMHRVLRPGGQAILPHPVHEDQPATFEDPTITDPRKRLQAFGATDHVRVYGADFSDRVRAAGFEVRRRDYLAAFSHEEVGRYGLGSEGRFLYIATKH